VILVSGNTTLFNPLVETLCFIRSCSFYVSCLLSAGDGLLVDDSLEESGYHASNHWTNQVNGQVHHCLWLRIWVGMTVEESLEDGLDEADGGVDAATGNTRGDLDGGVQGESNCDSIYWHVFGSIMLHDLENEGNEHTSHNSLDEEDLTNHLATIVAAVSWAQLGDIVGSWNWEDLLVLWEPHHGSGASKASEDGAEELEEHDGLPIDNSE